MEMLKFHTHELPPMAAAGARYVVVAYCGRWRDGLATSNRAEIPRMQRELRKRFMRRLEQPAPDHSPSLAAPSSTTTLHR